MPDDQDARSALADPLRTVEFMLENPWPISLRDLTVSVFESDERRFETRMRRILDDLLAAGWIEKQGNDFMITLNVEHLLARSLAAKQQRIEAHARRAQTLMNEIQSLTNTMKGTSHAE